MNRLVSRFNQIPSSEEEQACAQELASRLVQDVSDSHDPRDVVTWFGWKYSVRPFREGSTLRALLIPMLPQFRQPFSVAINANLHHSPEDIMVSVGHEIGHAHFYNTDQLPPRRIVPHLGREEERFCDRFSAEFIGSIAAAQLRPGNLIQ